MTRTARIHAGILRMPAPIFSVKEGLPLPPMPARILTFWSYSHDDNVASNGDIEYLASRVAKEFDLATGGTLRLFVDSKSIEWGDAWRNELEAGLQNASFLIPVITPRYFERPECRRELEEFANRLGGSATPIVLLPLLYVSVPGLKEDSPDPLVALIASTQYQDWKPNRKKGRDSGTYRRAIIEMVERIVELSAGLAPGGQSASPPLAEDDPVATFGLAETVAFIDERLPEWLDLVIEDKIEFAQTMAREETLLDRYNRQVRSGAPSGAKLATVKRLTQAMLPSQRERLPMAKVYLEKSRELNGPIRSVIEAVSQTPEYDELLDNLRDAVEEAVDSIRVVNPYTGSVHPLEHLSHMTRDISELKRLQIATSPIIGAGNMITLEWADLLGIDTANADFEPPAWIMHLQPDWEPNVRALAANGP